MAFNEFVGVTALLYALANPIGVIPIFLGLTRHFGRRRASHIIGVACVAVAAFLVLAVFFGKAVLEFFNVGLDDFRVAGGLFALFIAFEMFQAHYGGFMQTVDEIDEAEAHVHGIAITPLAFPLLVGPAEMGIMITMASDKPDWAGKLLLAAASVVTAALVAVTLWLALPINRLMGRTGINVATRVMALIVAAIGVHFIVTGLVNQMPGLLHRG